MNDSIKILLGALGGAIVTLLVVSVLGRGGMMGFMMSGGEMGSGRIGGLFSPLFWGLVVALIVWLGVWVVNQAQRR